MIEQAEAGRSDGNQRILESKLMSLHERIPLIFGSSDRIHDVIHYITGEAVENTRFPLFGNRGLLRIKGQIMSRKNPILSITGSSGAGTSTVKSTFEAISS